MARMRIDAQFEREAQSALRDLRDAEGVLRSGLRPGHDTISKVTVGRQWLESLIADRKGLEPEFRALELVIRQERAAVEAWKISYDCALNEVRSARERRNELKAQLNRIPRFVRRIFGVN